MKRLAPFLSSPPPPNAQCYDPAAHPDVSSGRMTPDEAFDDLSSSLCHQDADGQSEVTQWVVEGSRLGVTPNSAYFLFGGDPQPQG